MSESLARNMAVVLAVGLKLQRNVLWKGEFDLYL